MTKSHLLPILFPVSILLMFSLTILSSISPAYLQQQALSIVVGAILFIIFLHLDYHVYSVYPWIWYFISITSLAGTMVFGSISRGSMRWIDLGFFRLQPSEFVKPLLIIFFAVFLAKSRHTVNTFIQFLLIALLPVGLIFIQPDLGSALIIMTVIGAQFIASSMPKKYIIMTLVPLIMVSPIIWSELKPYQKDRVHSFIDPTSDPLGTGYNAIQAIISVGSGKIIGRGLGQGTQSQLKFLPERQTDFIFASIGEEFGFLGSITIVVAYIWLLYHILRQASAAKDEVVKLMSVGVFTVIIVQAFVNIGMNMGIVPITGITLPLVSLGGSSLISVAMMLGIITNTREQVETKKPILEIR